jgi:hypothetical protein
MNDKTFWNGSRPWNLVYGIMIFDQSVFQAQVNGFCHIEHMWSGSLVLLKYALFAALAILGQESQL